MAEYIDKKQAVERIASCYCMDCEHSNGILCRACEHQDDMDLIDDMPAADVQSVRYGKWISHGGNCYECSNCHNSIYQKRIHETHDHDFCGRCGADMRGDTK